MPNKNYKQGYRLENDLVNKLSDEMNWPLAFRSAGSHSCVDVIGITPDGRTYLFQCKSTEKIDIDLTSLFKDGRVAKLAQMPGDNTKCIVIRQKRKRGMLFFKYRYATRLWHPTNLFI